MVILGLDISTTCVGYAFTENKKILDMGFIDVKKYKTSKEKVFFIIDFLNIVTFWISNIFPAGTRRQTWKIFYIV